MTSEASAEVRFEIGHVLFIDIVGYSKLLINEQSQQIETLRRIVRGTEQFRVAEAKGTLLRLPTGDGGALVFRDNPEAPILCAIEISKALKEHPELRARMGIHSGPVNDVADLNDQTNIAGAGVNIAQRVMDCGDAGHILLSKRVAEDLAPYPKWNRYLHDIGECEVKHGENIRLVNFFTEEVGNAELPRRCQQPNVAPAARSIARTAVLALLILTAASLAIWQVRSGHQTQQTVAAMQAEMKKLREGIAQYPAAEAKAREAESGKKSQQIEERTYAELAKTLGVDVKTLRDKLPKFAEELKRSPDATTYERANAAYVAKDYSEAERLALNAADEAQKANPVSTSDVIKAFEVAGWSAEKRIEYVRALQHFRAAAALTNQHRDVTEWARIQYGIAWVLDDRGEYAQAETISREAVNVLTGTLGPEHPDTLKSRYQFGESLIGEGKYSEAELEIQAVLNLMQKVLGPEHPETLLSRMGLAGVHVAEGGRYAEAEAEYRTIFKLQEKALGVEHPSTLATRGNLAGMLVVQGNYAEAETEYKAVLKLEEKALGLEHPSTLGTRANLAAVFSSQGKHREAEAEYRAVIKVSERVLGSEHPTTLQLRVNLAAELSSQSKNGEAVTEYRAALKLIEKILGLNHANTISVRNQLAWLLATCRDPSVRNGREAVELATNDCELSHWQQPDYIDTLASAEAELGLFDAAVKHEQQAVQVAKQTNVDAKDFERRLNLYRDHKPYRE